MMVVNTMKVHRSILFASLVFLLLGANKSVFAQAMPYTAPYSYAYVTQAQTGQFSVELVNPAHHQQPVQLVTFTPPSNYVLSNAIVSPNGQYIAFVTASPTNENIDIYNVQTSTFQNISQSILSATVLPGNAEKTVVWSPDSRYLLFSHLDRTRVDANSQPTLVIYNVSSGALIDLGAMNPYSVAWALDSGTIAVFRPYCEVDCRLVVQGIDIISQNTTFLLDISKYISAANYPFLDQENKLLCAIKWSPNKTYLIFEMGCDPKQRSASDVYIANTNDRFIAPITHFRQTNPTRLTNFSTLWLDATNLLISLTTHQDADVDNKTLVYSVSTGSSTLINNNRVLEMWLQPNSNVLALSSGSYDNQLNIQNASSQIAEFNRNTFQVRAMLPIGCGLSWSPDGKYLSFEVNDTVLNLCGGKLKRLSFYNMETGEIVEYKWESSAPIYHFAGWVKREF